MKQYIIIILAILAGKYIDIPIWLNICFGIMTFWSMTQLEREWEE